MARKGSALRRMQRKEATDDKVPDTPRSLAHSFRIQMPPRGRTVERRCLSSSGGAFAFLSHGNEEPAVAAAWQREEDGEGTDLACLISSHLSGHLVQQTDVRARHLISPSLALNQIPANDAFRRDGRFGGHPHAHI